MKGVYKVRIEREADIIRIELFFDKEKDAEELFDKLKALKGVVELV